MALVLPFLFPKPVHPLGNTSLVASQRRVSGNATWCATESSADWTLSLNNFTALRSSTAIGFWALLRANIGFNFGSFTVTVDAVGTGLGPYIGYDYGYETQFPGQEGGNRSIGYQSNGSVLIAGGVVATYASYTTGDQIRIDKAGPVFTFYKNGVLQGSYDSTPNSGTLLAGIAYPTASNGNGTGTQLSLTAVTAAASNEISGTSTLTFAPSSTATGLGTLGGSSALTFADSATLTGLGTVAGSSGLVFADSGTTTGLGTVAGSSSLLLSPSGTATGLGKLLGSSALVLAPSGTLAGLGSLLGTSTVTFAPSATILGFGALAGSSSLALTGSAGLTGLGALLGSTSLSWGLSGTVGTASSNEIAGASTIAFSASAALAGLGQLSGSTGFTLTLSGQILAGVGGRIKVDLGSFTAKPVKVWDGVAWVEKPLKWWTGTMWQKTGY